MAQGLLQLLYTEGCKIQVDPQKHRITLWKRTWRNGAAGDYRKVETYENVGDPIACLVLAAMDRYSEPPSIMEMYG